MTKVTEEKPGLTGEVVESWSEPFPEEGDSIDAPGGAGQARWLRRRSSDYVHLAGGRRPPGTFLISHHLGNKIGCAHVPSPFMPYKKVPKIISAIGSAA